MKCFAVIGAKKRGKTSFVAGLIKRFNRSQNIILDINREYQPKFGIKNDYTGPLDHMDFLEYLEKTTPKAPAQSNRFIVFEEATFYIDGKSKLDRFYKQLVRSRHSNDTIVLIFHSLKAVPEKAFSLIDYYVIFKTLEVENGLRSKYGGNATIMEKYYEVKAHKDFHFFCLFENLA